MSLTILHSSNLELAEGPLWHRERESFFWVDIEGKTVYEYHWNSKKISTVSLPYRVSLVVPTANEDELLAGVQGGLATLDLRTHKLSWKLDLEKQTPEQRCNDGKCDASGRLWIGTMHLECLPGYGSLYMVDANYALHKKLDGLAIPNGMSWSASEDRFFFIDTPTYTIQSYFFDRERGTIHPEKTVVRVPESFGMPDGMTIDENGMLWTGQWGGACVCCWDPANGRLLEKIEIPAPNVTSCAFGGPQLDQLIITTAAQGLTREDLERYPLSGSIFIKQMNVRGTHAFRFGG